MFLRSRPVGPVTLEAILNSVGYSRIISCDIFDTAIERILARPDDVLLAVGARTRAAGLTHLDPDSFATAHRNAAQRVRAAATAQGWEEVRISEIYDELHAVDPSYSSRHRMIDDLACGRGITARNFIAYTDRICWA